MFPFSSPSINYVSLPPLKSYMLFLYSFFLLRLISLSFSLLPRLSFLSILRRWRRRGWREKTVTRTTMLMECGENGGEKDRDYGSNGESER